MTIDARFDRELPAILADLYLAPTPSYRDEVLAVATQRRQRPGWTFLRSVSSASAPRPQLRRFAFAAVVILAMLAVAVIAYVGSRPKVPSPFGVASNGLITWALDGDIYVGDLTDSRSARVVATDDIDRNPVFSRDGTHLAFLRQVPSQTGLFDLMVARADGSGLANVSPSPFGIPEAVEWAPDGKSLLVTDRDGPLTLTRFFVDGSPPSVLLTGVHLSSNALRPPDGAQILYERDDDQGTLYVMNADGSGAHGLFGPDTACACKVAGPARWSPDGRMIVVPVDLDGIQARLYRMNADGSEFRQLAGEEGIWIENDPTWSPDGHRIAFNRWSRNDAGEWTARRIGIVAATGGAVTEVPSPAYDGALIEWSPDGAAILELSNTVLEAFTWSPNAVGTVARPILIDIEHGTSRQLDWSVGSSSSWQRTAE